MSIPYPLTSEKMKSLIDVALGTTKADLVIINGTLVNVYTGEVLPEHTVAIKKGRIAYVGKDAEHTIGKETEIIDVQGKTLIPGFIDAHTHIFSLYGLDEFLKYVIKGGTTTLITESADVFIPLGYQGVLHFLESIKNQPIKILATAPPVVSISPKTLTRAPTGQTLKKLLKRDDTIGLGESYWLPIIQKDERILKLLATTLASSKKLEGHSAGAKNKKLMAYLNCGISSCHEPINPNEILERLRLGIYVMIREGSIRRDLESIAKIKDEKIDFRHLILVTDGVNPLELMKHGYLEFVVQKAIDLGFDPVTAIQMATLNPAEHFSLDHSIGGIAPGKLADIVVIPDPRTIQAELVISNGKVIAKKGEILVPPKNYTFSKESYQSVRLPRKLKPEDFAIPIKSKKATVKVRVINLTTELVTNEEQIDLTPSQGFLKADEERDILKVAVIERFSNSGKMFVGFAKGFKMRKGAFASSGTWDMSGIVVIGANDYDMAKAVNRILELQGGTVVSAEGKILAELPMPLGGYVADLPMENILRKLEEIQQELTKLGVTLPQAPLTLTTLTTAAIPFFRISESGLVDLRENKILSLVVPEE